MELSLLRVLLLVVRVGAGAGRNEGRTYCLPNATSDFRQTFQCWPPQRQLFYEPAAMGAVGQLWVRHLSAPPGGGLLHRHLWLACRGGVAKRGRGEEEWGIASQLLGTVYRYLGGRVRS